MGFLTTESGRRLACDGATAGQQFDNYLHVHTNAVDFVEAARLFGDARETGTLKYEENAELYVFRGYTELLGVQVDPLIQKPGELLIRLQRREEGTT